MEKHKVVVAGESVTLTAREFDLLVQFACHPGRVYTRAVARSGVGFVLRGLRTHRQLAHQPLARQNRSGRRPPALSAHRLGHGLQVRRSVAAGAFQCGVMSVESGFHSALVIHHSSLITPHLTDGLAVSLGELANSGRKIPNPLEELSNSGRELGNSSEEIPKSSGHLGIFLPETPTSSFRLFKGNSSIGASLP